MLIQLRKLGSAIDSPGFGVNWKNPITQGLRSLYFQGRDMVRFGQTVPVGTITPQVIGGFRGQTNWGLSNYLTSPNDTWPNSGLISMVTRAYASATVAGVLAGYGGVSAGAGLKIGNASGSSDLVLTYGGIADYVIASGFWTTYGLSAVTIGVSSVPGGTAKGFANGIQVGSAAVGTPNTPTNPFWIGTGFDGSTPSDPWPAAGVIGPLAIWTRTLSDAEFRDVTANIWQLFAAPPRRLWVNVAASAATDAAYEPTVPPGPPTLRLGTPVSRLRSGITDIEPTQFSGLPVGEPQVSNPSPLRLGTPFSRLRSSPGSVSGAQTFTQTLTATQAETVMLGPRNVAITRSVTQAEAVTLAKAVSRTLATATQATVATLVKQVGKTLTASQASAASFGPRLVGIIRSVTQAESLTLAKAVNRGLNATQAISATLAKAVAIIRTVSQATVATLVKGVRTTFATIAQAASATLTAIKVRLITLTTITQATSVSLVKSIALTRTIGQAASVVIVRAISLARSITQATATTVAKAAATSMATVAQTIASVVGVVVHQITSSGAGRHTRRFAVRDGDRLLVFMNRADAEAAKKAIAARDKGMPLKKLKLRATPEPVDIVPVATVRAVAEKALALPAYRDLARRRAYTPMIGLYYDLKRQAERREAMAREEEEIAVILLHLH